MGGRIIKTDRKRSPSGRLLWLLGLEGEGVRGTDQGEERELYISLDYICKGKYLFKYNVLLRGKIMYFTDPV